ncbi:MAG TPA: hypothetical protein VMF08_00005 [Candidatus Sulfotelmatobacter sp.]|nr:hypothetical protein [Candidatus Sulfotelmatobacter sp.]
MQRFRLLPAVVTISLASSVVMVHADDTPAQAAARAALMQQMNQMDTEQAPGSSNSVTAPATPATPPAKQPPITPPPAEQPPATPAAPEFSTNIPVATPPESGPTGVAVPAGSPMSVTNANANIAAAEKAMTNMAPISVPPPSVLTNDAAQYPVNPPTAPLPPSQAGETPTPTETPAISDDQTHPVAVPVSGSGGDWPKAAPSNPAAQQMPPGMAMSPGASLTHETQGTNSAPLQDAPLNAPPLPISLEKQSELKDLLQRYMANQITPVQYQEERARILAEP